MTTSRKHLSFPLAILTLLIAVVVTSAPAQAAQGDFFTWAKWRLGHAPYTCQAGVPSARPNVPAQVPASWWHRLQAHKQKPCPTAQAQAQPVSDVGLTAREAALRDAVNAERQKHGLAALPIDLKLERAATSHTADMIKYGYLAHNWHNGTPFGSWVTRYAPCRAGEILAWRSPSETPAGAIQQWLNSPPHRASLLSSAWTAMGVELTQQHAVVDFGGPC
jgi:uncharacterized protein YkwD